MIRYFRIFTFAHNLGKFLPPYALFMLLGVFLSVANLALIIPLLNVLFDQVDPETLNRLNSKPEFSLSLNWFIDTFNYYFIDIISRSGKLRALLFVCITLVSSVFLSNLFRYMTGVISVLVRTNIIRNLRTSIFNKITRMHLGYFTDQRKGDIRHALNTRNFMPRKLRVAEAPVATRKAKTMSICSYPKRARTTPFSPTLTPRFTP